MWRRCCAGEVRLYAGSQDISAEYLIVFVQSVGVFHHHDVDAARTGTEGNFGGAHTARHKFAIGIVYGKRGGASSLVTRQTSPSMLIAERKSALTSGHAGGLEAVLGHSSWKYIDTGMSPRPPSNFAWGP